MPQMAPSMWLVMTLMIFMMTIIMMTISYFTNTTKKINNKTETKKLIFYKWVW